MSNIVLIESMIKITIYLSSIMFEVIVNHQFLISFVLIFHSLFFMVDFFVVWWGEKCGWMSKKLFSGIFMQVVVFKLPALKLLYHSKCFSSLFSGLSRLQWQITYFFRSIFKFFKFIVIHHVFRFIHSLVTSLTSHLLQKFHSHPLKSET